MKKPLIKKHDLYSNEDIILQTDNFIVCKIDNIGIKLVDVNRNIEISADLQDWFDYALSSFSDKNVNKFLEFINYINEISCNKNKENFKPTAFKIKHKKTGLYSRKGNTFLVPENPNLDKIKYGWSYDKGNIWTTRGPAIVHLKRLVSKKIDPIKYHLGKEYYSARHNVLKDYSIIAIDNDGYIEEYDAIDLVPKTENNKKWADYDYWNKNSNKKGI